MNKILISLGTRPEFIKLYPLIKCFNRKKLFLINTSQHKSILNNLVDKTNLKFDLRLSLKNKNLTLSKLFSDMLLKSDNIIKKYRPKIVVVQGDTASAAAVALSAFHNQIPIAHVEAGLRTRKLYKPFPEEIYRQIIARVAKYNFAPTALNRRNLLSECAKGKIFITGNTVFDAIKIFDKKINLKKIKKEFERKNNIIFNKKTIKILFTCHRRENYGIKFENICKAINKITNKYSNVEILYPLHHNPNFLKKAIMKFKNSEKIKLLSPLSYEKSLFLIKNCNFIISDSGGIQEEAAFFKKYVIVIREETERIESVKIGISTITKINVNSILKKVEYYFKNKSELDLKLNKSKNPYLNCKSPSKKIFNILNKI